MPVQCSIAIAPLSTEEFRELDYQVMRHAFDSQNDLGRLADERIYQADLATRLQKSGLSERREVQVTLSFDSFSKPLFLDLLVDSRGVYELKVARAISEAHIGQLLTYLHLLDLSRGKIINFGGSKVESKFVNAPFRNAQRRMFKVVESDYHGSEHFRQLIVELLRDWGTSLTLSLYQEALITLLDGADQVEVMLPLHRDGICLGNQRFHLADSESAFKLTALNRDTIAYGAQLSRLLDHSPLKAIHWVNIEHEIVTLKTIAR
jgi:GxxExxY protein